MTKVTILGEAQGAELEKKKIEFVKVLKASGEFETPNKIDAPDNWEHLTLLEKNYTNSNLDLMFCRSSIDDKDPSNTGPYLGHFNDGVV